MSDDWEDWENDDVPSLPASSKNVESEKTKGELLLAQQKEYDASKFAGEDEGEDEEPEWMKSSGQLPQVFIRSTDRHLVSLVCMISSKIESAIGDRSNVMTSTSNALIKIKLDFSCFLQRLVL